MDGGQAFGADLRPAVAEFAQRRRGGLGVFGVGPGGIEAVVLLGGVAEHAVELRAHHLAVCVERGEQRRVVGKAHRLGDQRLVGFPGGQVVGLGVVQILQAMLEPAQEHVGGGQILDRLRRQDAALGQQGQHLQRRAHLQGDVATTADELEHLGDELDLADAARAELDVVGAVAAGDFAADLRVQLAHGVDRAEVEVLAEHERAGDVS